MRKLLLLVAVLASSSAFGANLSVADLLDKYKQAVGPLDKVTSQRVNMRLTGAAPFDLPFIVEAKRPNLIRKELSVQGQTQITAHDGKDAWKIDPFVPGGGSTKPVNLSEAETSMLLEEADFDGALINSTAKGTKITYAGPQTLEGKEVHPLQLTFKNNDQATLYLDGASFLEVKRSQGKEINGQKVTFDIFPSDYRKINGVQMAHKVVIITSAGAQPMTLLIDKIEQNVELAPSRFTRPAE